MLDRTQPNLGRKRGRPLSPTEREEIEQRFTEGESARSIATDMGRPRQTVTTFLRRRGLMDYTDVEWSAGPAVLNPNDPGEQGGDYRILTRAAMIVQNKAFCLALTRAITAGLETDGGRFSEVA